MWEHLPNDMVVEILLRLPVKSLVRLRCVCKDWYSLISSEFFITTHANRAVSRSCDKNMSSLVLFWYLKLIPARIGQPRVLVNYHHCSLRSDDASFGYNDNFIDLNVARFYPSWTPPKIVGSCNGLVCTTSGAGKYVLWNPSIHRALRLPEPNLNSKHSHYVDYHGLGYDSSNNDIKLVRLVYQSTKKPPKVEIYSLKSSCWRCLTAPSPPYLCSWPSSSIFVSGASHWIAHTLCDQGTSHEVIMAFDMVDEVFHEVPFPACFVGSTAHTATIGLALRDGLLCLVTYDRVQDQQVFSVWIMKEYGVEGSWTKLFNIHMNQRLQRVVGFRKNGEVLVSNVRGELLSYEPNTQQVTHLGFHRISTEEDYCRFKASYYLWENFVETMFLLNVKNGVL